MDSGRKHRSDKKHKTHRKEELIADPIFVDPASSAVIDDVINVDEAAGVGLSPNILKPDILVSSDGDVKEDRKNKKDKKDHKVHKVHKKEPMVPVIPEVLKVKEKKHKSGKHKKPDVNTLDPIELTDEDFGEHKKSRDKHEKRTPVYQSETSSESEEHRSDRKRNVLNDPGRSRPSKSERHRHHHNEKPVTTEIHTSLTPESQSLNPEQMFTAASPTSIVSKITPDLDIPNITLWTVGNVLTASETRPGHFDGKVMTLRYNCLSKIISVSNTDGITVDYTIPSPEKHSLREIHTRLRTIVDHSPKIYNFLFGEGHERNKTCVTYNTSTLMGYVYTVLLMLYCGSHFKRNTSPSWNFGDISMSEKESTDAIDNALIILKQRHDKFAIPTEPSASVPAPSSSGQLHSTPSALLSSSQVHSVPSVHPVHLTYQDVSFLTDRINELTGKMNETNTELSRGYNDLVGRLNSQSVFNSHVIEELKMLKGILIAPT
jgi:hypothetical protein